MNMDIKCYNEFYEKSPPMPASQKPCDRHRKNLPPLKARCRNGTFNIFVDLSKFRQPINSNSLRKRYDDKYYERKKIVREDNNLWEKKIAQEDNLCLEINRWSRLNTVFRTFIASHSLLHITILSYLGILYAWRRPWRERFRRLNEKFVIAVQK